MGNDLRTIEIEGEPRFAAVDVLKCLGLRTGNGEHYKKLGADEQASSSRAALGMHPGKPMKVVSESGLYKLIMRSDKATARPFQDWVTRDVLPAIRKTGGYAPMRLCLLQNQWLCRLSWGEPYLSQITR